ncbi:MAG TPA: isoprenylcysteine carboxyl methyltransferase [Rikenellaceae bacterium]|nr:isoprenylcysteine carboxyl methyltransferase [Rikenellaceae bacterium]
MIEKIIALILMAVFYTAYLWKKISQKRQGIRTNQIGKGNKPKKVIRIERLMGVATFTIVPVEITSIIMYPSLCLITPLSGFLRCSGLTIATLGIIFFITAMITMSDSWRAGIPDKDKTTLIQSGIYQISRNPAFVGFDLMYIGLFMAFPNIFHLIFAIFPMIMLHLQILQEEGFCHQTFGAPYETYFKRVHRYL